MDVAPPSPFDDAIGSRLTEVGAEGAVVRLTVGADHHQPGGLVHGGVLCTLVETAASYAANAWLAGAGVAVGASNHTELLRPVRGGELTAEATPLQRGRRLQLWQVSVVDDDGRLVAHGTLRLANLEAPDGSAQGA